MSRVTKALIPAAGRGTRFLPLTKSVPKELAPLVSTPALEFVVAEAADHGVTDVLLVTSAGKSAITDYFERDKDLEAALERKGDTDGTRSNRSPPAGSATPSPTASSSPAVSPSRCCCPTT